MAVAGGDGWLYFGHGAMTNSGVVGLDAYEIGWLRRLPHAHDVPGLPVRLRGQRFTTADPLTRRSEAVTGAFAPFGTPSRPGQVVEPGLPCTASVMRCRTDGSGLELVAWGTRPAYGLCFLPDGRLLALDQGPDARGRRPGRGAAAAPAHRGQAQPGRRHPARPGLRAVRGDGQGGRGPAGQRRALEAAAGLSELG